MIGGLVEMSVLRRYPPLSAGRVRLLTANEFVQEGNGERIPPPPVLVDKAASLSVASIWLTWLGLNG